MEGHDTFQQGIEIGDEDPFAGSDFGDWEQPSNDSSPEQQQPTGYSDAPPVPGESPPTPPAVAESQPPASAAPPQSPASAPAPANPPAPEPQAAEAPPVEPAQGAPAPAPAPPSAPAGTGAPPTGQTAPQSAPQPSEAERREQEQDVPIDTEGLPEPTTPELESGNGRDETRVLTQDDLDEAGYDGPVADADEVPVTHPAHPVNQPEPTDAPEPEEQKDKRGRVTHRRYIILQVTGHNKFEQLDWFEDKQHNLVARNTSGAKRQTVVLARGTEDALKFGYAVIGAPQAGADLIAVAAAYFQTKHIEPEPPEPMKQRLRIS